MRNSCLFLLLVLVVVGCGGNRVSVPLRSLARSGAASFLCVNINDGDENPGRDLDACPDFDFSDDDVNELHFFSMVTQTETGEVAVLDLTEGGVVDVDPGTPGFNFLPVGERPVSIASTPGGQATFVGVAELGREGIYGLPTSCAGPPAQDLLAWPACSLPSAPGPIEVVIDPAIEVGGELAVRARCDGPESAYDPLVAEPGTAAGATRSCPADLAREVVDPGRRKLVVSLPDEGGVAIIDAQSILDRAPGSFDACPIDRFIPLQSSVPDPVPSQIPPDDLVAPGCDIVPVPDSPVATDFPRPAGMDLEGSDLYIADQGAPLVHIVDLSDPCAPRENPPLLPVSWDNPGRTVTTSDVAVSPVTSNGKRFVYAIDEFDDEGSVMIFDVSDGAASRTPIVRPRSPRMPFEPPDRIKFDGSPRAVEFVLRDRPIVDPVTGVAVVGTECNPDPAADENSSGAQQRPSSDLTRGAGPRRLRGIFGMVALTNGRIVVIDVEDFDAPCRRPADRNPVALGEPLIENFRGCIDPDTGPDQFLLGDEPTVTNEVSCNVVEEHRARSSRFVLTNMDVGPTAPGIRSFAPLTLEGVSRTTGQDDEGRGSPKMLGVPYADGSDAQVFVGTTRHIAADAEGDDEELLISPVTAVQNSVVLNFDEPRAFATEEDFIVVYEGALIGNSPGGNLGLQSADPTLEGLVDGNARFCGRGVRDVDAMREVGVDLGVPEDQLDAFVRRHGDYVQITTAIREEDDSYWTAGVGMTCGGADNATASFNNCDSAFGEDDPTRDFRILEAYQDQLVLEPREFGSVAQRDELMALASCCFPSLVSYRVRAGHHWIVVGGAQRFAHHMTTQEDASGRLRCVSDCNPFRRDRFARAFEITCEGSCAPNESGIPAVGPPIEGQDFACRRANPDATASDPTDPCIFRNTSLNFAIYRGAALDVDEDTGQTLVVPSPSQRDERFSFTVIGGFATLFANLAASTSSVTPSSMTFIPQIGELAVVDGAEEGLALVSLETVTVRRVFF